MSGEMCQCIENWLKLFWSMIKPTQVQNNLIIYKLLCLSYILVSKGLPLRKDKHLG